MHVSKRRFSIVVLLLFGSVFGVIGIHAIFTSLAAPGNTYYASPGDNLQQKVNQLQPGDTLILNDGTYTSPLNIQSHSGTPGSPLTIKAAHDGKAILDDNYSTAVSGTAWIYNSAYIVIQGISIRNSGKDILRIDGSSNNISVQRVTGSNAGSGNWSVFDIEASPSASPHDILFEDCAGWGRGRYIFLAYHATNITFRRDWAAQPYATNFTNAPRNTFGVYGSTNVTLENDIGTDAIPTAPDTDFYTSVWQTSDGPANDNTRYYGDIFYNNCEGIYVNASAGKNTQLKDVFLSIPYNATCQNDIGSSRYLPRALEWYTANSGTASNLTIVNSQYGYYADSPTGPAISDSVFLNNNQAFLNAPSHSFSDFYGNQTLGTSLVSSDKQVDPGYNTAAYGMGAYIFIPASSPLKHAGSNGADMGANIIYEYVNGQQTGAPLWPWPMESRIMSEKGVSVTWATNGGIWKTLNGVYPSTTPVPGDCNGDGHITITDLSELLSHFNQSYGACDFNGDGIINITDLSILLSNYGQ